MADLAVVLLLLLVPIHTPSLDSSSQSIVERYAPFLYHAADETEWRQDIPTNIDFDGDFVGNNNWENFPGHVLRPAVYYSLLETESHYFISFHLFHPRDWNHFTFWLHDTHENDGENFQVVIRKGDGRVVLLWTQAHYESETYVMPWSGITSGVREIDGSFLLLDDDGVPSSTGEHVAVFVESQGHGIYGTQSANSGVGVNADGTYHFDDGRGWLLRPGRDGAMAMEPKGDSGVHPYVLISTTDVLWPLLRDGKLSGDGKLLDGSYEYIDRVLGRFEVPRYYDADRYSGPFGPDRGISPFALDFEFDEGTLGSLFFSPARRYVQSLTVTDAWSFDYVGYPYVSPQSIRKFGE